MNQEEIEKTGIAKLEKTEMESLNKWLNSPQGKMMCSGLVSQWEINNISDLEGTRIYSSGGIFLGVISMNKVMRHSIANSLGPYGSEFSDKSIMNDFSQYGSSVSHKSAFNSIASEPPKIFKNDKFVAYLTINQIKIPRVDSYKLLGYLKKNS
jgi:hypothetical protein